MKTSDDMKRALKAVREGMSLRKAVRTFSVSKTTLQTLVNKKKVEVLKIEKSGKLSENDQERLTNWFIYCQMMGYFPITPIRLGEEAARLSKYSGNEQKFTKSWCKNFIRKQKQTRVAAALYRNIKMFDKQTLEIWTKSLKTFCRSYKLKECLQNSQQLLYCCKLDINENLKMILSFSASGMATPPLLIAAKNQDSDDILDDFDDLALPQGWIKHNCKEVPYDQDRDGIYRYYLEHILKTYLRQKGKAMQKPVVLFCKNENVIPNVAFYELCCKLQVFPVNCYPSAFKINDIVQNEILSGLNNLPNKQISYIVDVVKNAIITKLTKASMVQSFLESGVYPMDINIVELPPPFPLQNIQESDESSDEDNDKVEEDEDDDAEIEHIDTADIIAATPGKRRRRISLDAEEFRNMIGDELSVALEEALDEDDTVECKHSKEFMALLQIQQRFCGDDDPLSGVNAIQVEPDVNLQMWE